MDILATAVNVGAMFQLVSGLILIVMVFSAGLVLTGNKEAERFVFELVGSVIFGIVFFFVLSFVGVI